VFAVDGLKIYRQGSSSGDAVKTATVDVYFRLANYAPIVGSNEKALRTRIKLKNVPAILVSKTHSVKTSIEADIYPNRFHAVVKCILQTWSVNRWGFDDYRAV
jgi:hypothetical protein